MKNYRIPFWRKWFIKRHFGEWSFNRPDDYVPDKKLFLKLQHPAELHYLADIYNWDDGSVVLEWILDSELCSRATVNLLFWRAAPDWYMKFDLDDIDSCPSYNRDGFRVIQKALRKYENNDFSVYQIGFDPTSEIEDITSMDRKWEVPKEMYENIPGVIVK